MPEYVWLFIGVCITAVLGFVARVMPMPWQRRLSRADVRKANAEAADLYEKVAERAAAKALKLADRIGELETALQQERQKRRELERKFEAQMASFEEKYREVVRGAWMLHEQVEEADIGPRYTPPELPA